MPRSAWLALAVLAIASPSAAQTPAAGSSAAAMTVALPPPPPPTAPDIPRGRISGLMSGDAHYNASGDSHHVYSTTGADDGKPNIDGVSPITRDLNGVQLRRAYFQYDDDLSIKYSTRFLLEADGKELSSGGKVTLYVNQAYF